MSAVTLMLTAGSVVVQADIVLSTAEGATFAASQLSAGVLASSEALETALNTQFEADGVEATASVQAIVDAPEVVSTGDDSQGGDTSLLFGIVAGVGVAAAVLGLFLVGVGVVWLKQRKLWLKQRKQIGGALEQSAGAIAANEAPVVELAEVSGAPPPYAATGVYPPPMHALVPKVQAATVVGVVQQASMPGSSTQQTHKHTLATDVEVLKREMGLNGNISEVVKEAATQLLIDFNGRPLSDVSMECVKSLGVFS